MTMATVSGSRAKRKGGRGDIRATARAAALIEQVDAFARRSGRTLDDELAALLALHQSNASPPQQLELDLSLFDQKARIVETARRIYGRAAAKRLWQRLGLPNLSGIPLHPPDPDLMANVDDFVRHVLKPNRRGGIRAAALYDAYTRWAETLRRPSLSMTMFGRLMRHTAIDKRRGRCVIYMAEWL